MNLVVYGQEKKDEKVRLELSQCEESVELNIVSKDGVWQSTILKILPTGYVRMNSRVSDLFGFKLDESGHVITILE